MLQENIELASKKNKLSSVVPFIVLPLLLVGLVLINRAQNAPQTPDAPAKPATPPAAAAPVTQTVSNGEGLAPEVVVNSPASAATVIQVGWQYDPGVQVDPSRLKTLISMMTSMATSSRGKVALIAADIDLPKDQLSPMARAVPGLGVYINGKPSAMVDGKVVDLSGNPGSGNLTIQTIGPALESISSQR
jgi:hypothetical protein